MLTNSDRTILYGTMAFIAYQLWKSRQGMAGTGSGCAAPSGPANTGSSLVAPTWLQQWSNTQGGINYFAPTCGMWGRCS